MEKHIKTGIILFAGLVFAASCAQKKPAQNTTELTTAGEPIAQSLPAEIKELVFPPKVNLFRYSVSPSGSTLYGFPNTRLWGWSSDGKAAYSIETMIEGRGGQRIDFVIMDTITDNLVFDIKLDSFDYNDVTDEDLYKLAEVNILNALKTYNISGPTADYLQFPAAINNTVYNGSIIDVKHGDDEYGFFGAVVTEYTVSVSAGSQSKVIGKFTPVYSGTTGYVYVCGYFLSPFENRILAAAAEEHWGFEGTELTYRFLGCHLDAGFK